MRRTVGAALATLALAGCHDSKPAVAPIPDAIRLTLTLETEAGSPLPCAITEQREPDHLRRGERFVGVCVDQGDHPALYCNVHARDGTYAYNLEIRGWGPGEQPPSLEQLATSETSECGRAARMAWPWVERELAR